MSKVLYEKKDKIAYITLNRPEVLNAVDPETSALIGKYRTDFQNDPRCWVMILTGTGEKAFSAGMDLKARAAGDARGESIKTQTGTSPIWDGVNAIRQMSKPTIAAINGYCIAGGLELALSCDIRIASENAKFGMPEVKRAISPGTGLVLLPRVVPLSEALYLLMTGDMVDAQKALRIGLIQEIVPPAELMPRADQIAQSICDNGPLAVRAVKQAALAAMDLPLREACKFAESLFYQVFESEDAKEGPRAFAEGRSPVYEGK